MLTSTLMLVRLTISYVLLERRKARATPSTLYQALLTDWLARCGAGKRSVQLRISPDITTPVAAGPYRSSILIPARMMNELNEDELKQIGLHESAHFARRDDCALIFQRILEALFVFHPVVRWITRRIDLEREIACDDFVIGVTGNPRPYAACLTRVVELAGGVSSSHLAASAAESPSHLETRVEMLLDNVRKTSTHLLKPRLAAAVATILMMTGVAAKAPSLVLFAKPPAPAVSAAQSPVVAAAAPAIPPAEAPQNPVARFAPAVSAAQSPVVAA